ncbi:MAG: DUF1269 domain-containing protein [Granulosicoccaceae bacterium]|jgi:hypothetical protein
MRRLYFVIPNIPSARQIVDELLLARVDARHIHVISRDDSQVVRAELPEATLLEKTDIIPAFERGIVAGFAVGLLCGGLAIMFPPAGLDLGGGSFLAITLAGTAFGAWSSSMIGVSLHNSQLKRFEPAIETGSLLMMVDVPKKRAGEINQLVSRHHPEAHAEGVEPTMPAFP